MAASKVGTIDPMGKSRVFTNELLEEVPAGSPEAAFSWKRGELEARRARREELGLNKNDEALRAQLASQKASIPAIERRIMELQAQLQALQGDLELAAAEAAGSKPAKAKGKAKADEADAETEAAPEATAAKA